MVIVSSNQLILVQFTANCDHSLQILASFPLKTVHTSKAHILLWWYKLWSESALNCCQMISWCKVDFPSRAQGRLRAQAREAEKKKNGQSRASAWAERVNPFFPYTLISFAFSFTSISPIFSVGSGKTNRLQNLEIQCLHSNATRCKCTTLPISGNYCNDKTHIGTLGEEIFEQYHKFELSQCEHSQFATCGHIGWRRLWPFKYRWAFYNEEWCRTFRGR